MALVKFCFLVLLLLEILCLTLALTPKFVDDRFNGEHVKRMSKDDFASPRSIKKRSINSDNVLRQKRDLGDAACQNQETTFLNKLKEGSVEVQFAHQYAFPNESKYSIALVWVGVNTQKILVTVTEENRDLASLLSGGFAEASTVYISKDSGKTFENITKNLDNGEKVYIKRSNGLQKNPSAPEKIYIVAHGNNVAETELYISKDNAETFTKTQMPFTFSSNFVFHPTDPSYILAHDGGTTDLYLSSNFGSSWQKIKSKVLNFRWSTREADAKYTIYAGTDENSLVIIGMVYPSGHTKLEKSEDAGGNWKTIHDDILTFGLQGNFLFASITSKSTAEERYMEVSTSGGDEWSEVQLPTITEDRFYSILDMSEGQIFMHVDDPGDTGVGTLYNSDSKGVIFSQSLSRHLYPNYEDLTDFYKVESMRGVYISSQLQLDLSIRTMISRDRGGEWAPLQRPVGVPCKDETKECYLQIHNQYSANRGVRAAPPKSVESAVGIILVHGHVASSLQTTDPDVFVTSDGGYTWRLALKGPHHYEIADQGGLLVAVPSDTTTPKTVRFSTDEGRCWHSYKFTDEDITFTGLLTEPGNKAMTVAIWGYGAEDKVWRAHTVDFETVITKKCTETDYDTWVAHSDNTKDGCLLGVKETFQRLKPDSWCLNGHSREVNKEVTKCACTKADYDCDYGFIRDAAQNCVKDPVIKTSEMDICQRGELEELAYVGYHVIPGDQCEGGFTPDSDTIVDLKKHCEEGDKSWLRKEEGIAMPVKGKNHSTTMVLLIAVALIAFLVVTILVAYIVKKYRDLKQSKLAYRYSNIRTEENEPDDLERALATHTSLYEDSSDDETMSIQTRTSNGRVQRSGPVPPLSVRADSPPATLPTQPPTTTHAPLHDRTPPPVSFHDDSDEDMLE